MNLTEFFAYLGAPLANNRWSWGAVRPGDAAVVLRVWQDEWKKIGDLRAVRITDGGHFAAHPDSHGYIERMRQIDLIRAGNPSYMIMCLARDVNANPREIQSFNDTDLFVGGRLIEHGGETWLEAVRKVPIAEVRS